MVTVFGLGFVGLTTALGFARLGHKVYGIEQDSQKMELISSGQLPFLEPGLDEALTEHLGINFIPTGDLQTAIQNSRYIYYCVGTPYGTDGQADLSHLFKAIEQTLEAIQDDEFRVLVVKSTVPPSTTQDRVIPFLEQQGVYPHGNVGVANNPEFLREGHCWDDFIHADRIVLGVNDPRSQRMLEELYRDAGAPIFSVSLNTGEFIKYLSNTLLATLISYSNEMSLLADGIGGIDIAPAFRILHLDKRWGGCDMASYAYPGCGYGGYCLPKDTSALYALAQSKGLEADILGQVIALNDRMPQAMAQRIEQAALHRTESKIGILGLSFKPGSDDVRQAPSAAIIARLLEDGYRNILGYDPVANALFARQYNFPIAFADSLEQVVEEADLLVIATAWEEFKDLPTRTKKPIVDCRYIL